MLTLNLPTIAAIDGHAFAGGCILAFGHDYIVMNNKKGFICMNEVDINVPLSQARFMLMRTKIACPRILKQVTLEGKRFTAQQAFDAGFVDVVVDDSSKVIPEAFELGYRMSKKAIGNGTNFGILKMELNKNSILEMTKTHTTPGTYLSKL
ncbi:Enoyl-CoA delta isomerase 1, peroxisomal [Smittium culicis]|nr:Enoyl-CoA delta isomerase 1, peroxisomal [Smittium culicis]